MRTQIKYLGVVLPLALVVILGTFAYTQAQTGAINACTNKNGVLYLVGTGFAMKECRKGDIAISWNAEGVQGPQGEKGDKGEKGDDGKNATFGAGNILFFVEGWDGSGVALDKNGIVYTLYVESDGSSTWRPTSNNFTLSNINPPVPVQDILVWKAGFFIETDGDVWIYRSNDTWINAGQP